VDKYVIHYSRVPREKRIRVIDKKIKYDHQEG
jgi:hypothetical protein